MRSTSFLTAFISCLVAPYLLTGCSANFSSSTAGTSVVGSISGLAQGGRQPIYQAHIYLLEANTTTYAGPGIAPDDSNTSTNNASKSLLTTGDGADALGFYVLTAQNGTFTLPSGYTCDTGSQVYLYSLGGKPDGVNSNPNAGLMAILGTCGSFGSGTTVNMNELSTIAAAYAFAGFATDATHVGAPSSTDALAATGIANAFANAVQLFDTSTNPYSSAHSAPSVTKYGNGAAPQMQVNTLANILSSCVNTSVGGTQCGTLFSGLQSGGATGAKATDTASEAIYMAHNSAITSIYSLTGPGANPYTPWFNVVAPSDLNVIVEFPSPSLTFPSSVAIDASGNAWIANNDSAAPAVVALSPLGVPSSGSPFTGPGFTQPDLLAIDSQGNIWVNNNGGISPAKIDLSTNPATVSSFGSTHGYNVAVGLADNVWSSSSNVLYEFYSSGSALRTVNPSSGIYPGGSALAIDGSGNIWTSGYQSGSNGLVHYSSTGTLLNSTTFTAAGLVYPNSLAIDHTGNVWLDDYSGGFVYLFDKNGTSSPLNPIKVGAQPGFTAIDGSGRAWITITSGVAEVSSGAVVSPTGGFGSTVLLSNFVAIDGSGNVWVTGDSTNSVWGAFEIFGAATPVVTPLSAGSQNSTLGSRP